MKIMVCLYVVHVLQLNQDARNVMKVMEQHVLFVIQDFYILELVLMTVLKRIGMVKLMYAINAMLLV